MKGFCQLLKYVPSVLPSLCVKADERLLPTVEICPIGIALIVRESQ
jgi:hypothetical protein